MVIMFGNPSMLLAIKEEWFAKRAIKRLLKAHSAVSAEKPSLAGIDLYREILLHTRQVSPQQLDQILEGAEDSVDEWTAPGREGLGFREVVHFFVMSQYQAAGRMGATISFRELVNSLVPADL
jgi:hypothetical protein